MAGTELWLVDFSETGIALEAAEATTPRLSDDTLRRIAAMSNDAARRERRLSHIALSILLERHLGPELRRAPYARNSAGKPSLEGCSVPFNIAHTHGLALIAVGGGNPLGVDIERMRSITMTNARRALIENAAVVLAGGAPLAEGDDDTRFLSAWVRVEAAAKAEGGGVGLLLESLRPGASALFEGLASKENDPIAVHDVPAGPGVFAAVALGKEAPQPPLRRLPASSTELMALIGGN